ncbi:unnamed protein product [Hymenolepis diminuta]|uniref:Uncharacterized protein n=1 Tax=Hymenolepis diminuta TaxID=6216 RepID=A0A564Y9R1_HYMDI|nr:unnamed protein product [Hymenolepis diminuta]
MSKRAHQFLPSYNFLILLKMHICAHVLARPYPSDSIKLSLFFTQEQCTPVSYRLLRSLLTSSLSQHAPFSISLLHSFKKLIVGALHTFWSNQLLVFCSTIVVSSYSNSYELPTVFAVAICWL